MINKINNSHDQLKEVVEQFSNVLPPDVYADLLRKGAQGNADAGLLEGFTSLDTMARMDGNSIITSKALIGSDLLFDFNVHALRQSARVSLMKVALLIDSGAATSVAPKDTIPGVMPVVTEGTKNRLKLRAANGAPMEHQGELATDGKTLCDKRVSIPMQALPVTRPLTKNGYRWYWM